jgi:integrase
MANIRKRGDKWQAEVRIKGNGRTKSFNTRAEAQRWALEFEHQLGRNPGVILARSLGEAMQRYAKEISPSKKGAQWEIVRLKKLERDPIAHIQLADLRADDFASWMQRQTIGNASINRELTLIASVLRVARVQWKWMLDNPMADVRRPKQPPSRDRLLSPDEIKRILLALQYDEAAPVISARQEIAVTMLLALETAMRRGEIYSLDWCNVHLKRKFLTLPDTKNGTRRDVPLTPRAVELLKKLKPKEKGKVIHGSQVSADTIFRGAVKLAGITGLTFHDTRHTAITNLARKLDVLDLARMVGHRDLRSLQVYYNATAEDIAKRLAS